MIDNKSCEYYCTRPGGDVVTIQDNCRNCLYSGERLKEGSTGALVGVQLFCMINRADCSDAAKCSEYMPRSFSRLQGVMYYPRKETP